jgi:hypothetical protein
MKNASLVLGLGGLLIAAGCGGTDPDAPSGSAASVGSGNTSGGQGGATTGGTVGATGTATGSGGGGAGDAVWTELITADWELSPGSEKTSDLHSITVDHDIYVGGIRPIAPTGTHHTLLALNGLNAGNVIYASGLGTNAVMFPPGVGLKIAAGETVVLQLHLFNPSASVLGGLSGIEIVEVAAEDVTAEADLFLPGPLDLTIPPNQQHTQSGTCTVNQAASFFAVFPHMHQLGSHLKTTLTTGGTPQVLHDGDYEFEHQAFISFAPIAVSPGDTITTECTWDNTTSDTIGWGESSTTEMCFSILYRYPAQGGENFCTQ